MNDPIKLITDDFAARLFGDIECEVIDVLQKAGSSSPIEKFMALALRVMNGFSHDEIAFRDAHQLSKKSPLVQIFPQLAIGKYRVDFAILVNGPDGQLRYVVECDGHNFHEKTKAQAIHDKSRDRYLQRCGWKVMRFSGSEIFRRPVECAEDVSDQLWEDLSPRKKTI